MVQLGDVIEFEKGKAAANVPDGTFPLYGSNGIIGRVLDAKYENAVIIGRVGACCGSTMYWRTSFWASDNTIVAKPISQGSLCVEAVYHVLRELNLRRYAGGSGQQLITQTTLRRLQMVVPDEKTNRRINEILEPVHGLIIALESKTTNLRTTRDLLLSKLISGEIWVEAVNEGAGLMSVPRTPSDV
jgi:type I restriction enzyme S subunit